MRHPTTEEGRDQPPKEWLERYGAGCSPGLNRLRWKLYQMALTQTDESPEPELLRLLKLAESQEQLERLAESVREAGFVIFSCPDFTRALLQKAGSVGAQTRQEVFQELRQVSAGVRSFSDRRPDEEWTQRIETLKQKETEYAGDPEVGPPYSTMRKQEQERMHDMRERTDSMLAG